MAHDIEGLELPGEVVGLVKRGGAGGEQADAFGATAKAARVSMTLPGWESMFVIRPGPGE
ncbi:hypothetical protein CR103_13970 [Massilia psychrophila]|uniref:Uncharacterized protein n=1 Tax=Massilia psychrophila TaxID=1603353 RepID=A0A2G8SZJ1_9BURK|nr:hypothetical protein CR103_13970 [Massilia psychrophila]GGE82203.1 hypothetical protein GCM10008020_28910 [Massilia psychrophila]